MSVANTFQVLHSRVGPWPYPTNIRLGWKGLPGTNTLTYYAKPQITAVFIVLAQGINYDFPILSGFGVNADNIPSKKSATKPKFDLRLCLSRYTYVFPRQ
jgi:hypothetical protein